jgi:hypothetical protein
MIDNTPSAPAESTLLESAPDTSTTPDAPVAPQGSWKGFAGEDGTFSADWTKHLPEDLGDARAGLSRFRNVADLGKSYLEAQRMIGQKANSVSIPGKDAKPEELTAYRKSIGVPENVEDYNFQPEKMPDGVDWNNDLVKPIAAIAYKHNIPASVMRELASAHSEIEAQRSQLVGEAVFADLENGKATLQREWGDSFDKNIVRASNAAKMVGVDPSSPGFRDPAVVRAIYELSQKLSDDNFVSADGAPLTSGGKSSAMDIMKNKDNPYYDRYQAGDKDVVAMVRRYLQ